MNKFDRVLSDEWMPLEFKSGNDVPVTSLMVNLKTLKSIVEQAEQAVLAKLAGQGPVAYAAFSYNGNIRLWSTLPQIGDGEVDLYPLYAHPMPNCQGILDSSSVPDGFRLVNEEELIELSDSILGNYYRGQDWERERITNMLKAAPCVSHASDKAACVSENGESETQSSKRSNW